jgi:hypothetical protein
MIVPTELIPTRTEQQTHHGKEASSKDGDILKFFHEAAVTYHYRCPRDCHDTVVGLTGSSKREKELTDTIVTMKTERNNQLRSLIAAVSPIKEMRIISEAVPTEASSTSEDRDEFYSEREEKLKGASTCLIQTATLNCAARTWHGLGKLKDVM